MNDKDVIIGQLMAEIQHLRNENKALREEIDRLKKNSGNSSKPPSSDIVKPPKPKGRGKKKRQRGGQKGHKKFERPAFTPEQIDQTIEYELRDKDVEGLEPLDEWFIIQQVELPEKMFHVTEHRARKYLDPLTGQIHIAPIPDTIRKGGLLGGRFTSMVAFMKSGCHGSYGTIQKFCQEIYGLDLSRGMLNKAVQKVSEALKEPYEQLVDQLPHESYLGVDETGHKDDGKLHWSWCFQNSQYCVFHINPSRGSQVLKAVLGETFAGTLGSDYYSAYRKYMKDCSVLIQYCMAHLIREICFLAEHSDAVLSRWGKKMLGWMKKLFETLHKKADYTAKGFKRRMESIKQGFLRQVRRPPDHKLARKLKKRFKGKKADNYFVFLADPNVEPTNNSTEQAIRYLVIDRYVTQGTRGQNGMRWCERAWTVVATCKRQGRNVFDFIHKAIIAHWTKQPRPTLLC